MINRLIHRSIACLFVLVFALGLPLHLVQAAGIQAVLNEEDASGASVELLLKDTPEYVDDSLQSFNEPLTIQAYQDYRETTERMKQAALKKKQEQLAKAKQAEEAKLRKAKAKAAAEAAMAVSERDLHLLARIVYAESRGEPFIGQVAVAAVVLNRVQSSEFPDTIEGVIEQPRAFTAVDDGQYELQPDSTAYKAAREALRGTDPTGGALYYFNPKTATSKWIWSRTRTIQIGRHIFAK
ncbi:cell wall hydrolase [Paenibacillus thailandensis]|uniref:Cell wall hydrolase n=1 Tax=Paenibacillus thailandensis TaxID=393250 RepID=A0ABW5QTM1_9BACL